jgi:rod shape-determining protein MreC
VVEAGRRASRILLLTDLNSRVPVVVESSRYRAILEGDNSDALRLGFLPDTGEVRVGDRIVTSGHGGLFPAGLPVGIVTELAGDAAVVTPHVRLDRVEYVQVLLFDFPTLDPASKDALAGAER